MNRNHRNTGNNSPLSVMLIEIFSICFGVFWTVMAGSMFPPMAIFGIFFIAIGVVNLYNTYKTIKENANKPHEHQEICSKEEFAEKPRAQKEELRCPYCGAPVSQNSKKCEYCDSEF